MKTNKCIVMDGKSIKKNILEELREEVSLLEVRPKLVVIQVGNDDASNVYIKQKKKMAEYIGYEYEHIKALGQGSQNNINAQIVKDYLIPVPPLAEQQRIVDILDRFDSLTNDLTAGLPAEIEKRRQQYEFYRDKLLTFKRK